MYPDENPIERALGAMYRPPDPENAARRRAALLHDEGRARIFAQESGRLKLKKYKTNPSEPHRAPALNRDPF